jgi:hypothetical protein
MERDILKKAAAYFAKESLYGTRWWKKMVYKDLCNWLITKERRRIDDQFIEETG